jgi:ABC-2 type transport system ATP-binding protein
LIEVENLTKKYGGVCAVDQVSFRVEKGEILGFLGPNGAGKTTTMRVLAGYLPATSGTARIAGLDIFEDSLEVRKRIGYLPENPPLYSEMSVAGYLRFVARIKQVPGNRLKGRVDAALEMARITDKRSELIKRLSRGYRQRVGLAQALVHDPEVIILDEPTVGLDPKQIIEVRHLIKSLAGSHTIILSTHILPEVSMTCDRVVIIHHGRIVAVDTPESLTLQRRSGEQVHVEVKPAAGGTEALLALLRGIPGVKSAEAELPDAGGRVQAKIQCDQGQDLRSRIATEVVRAGHELFELRASRVSLEDIFLKLTTEEETETGSQTPAAEQTVVTGEAP